MGTGTLCGRRSSRHNEFLSNLPVTMNVFPVFILVVALLALLVLGSVVPIRLWIEAVFAGVRVGLGDLVGMRLRKVNPAAVIRPLIAATKAGLNLNSDQLQAHYLARGHVDSVVTALISADKANLGLDFKQAAAIDLAGRDVLDAVKTSVTPRVIETPRVAAVCSRSALIWTRVSSIASMKSTALPGRGSAPRRSTIMLLA